ncbi:hypothetical protein GCM10023306_01870 [Novosphingobium ginsenosidimutans]
MDYAMIAPSKAVRPRITGPLPSEVQENVRGTFSPKGPASQNLGYPMGGWVGERAGDAPAVRRAKI